MMDGLEYSIPEELEELNELSRRGCVEASLFLKKLYSEGGYYGWNDRIAYKYTCYAALAGDIGSARELYESGRKVCEGFPEDYREEEDYFDLHCGRIEYNRTEYLEEGIYFHGTSPKEIGFMEKDKGDNSGYVDPRGLGVYDVLWPDTCSARDLLLSLDPSLENECPPRKTADIYALENCLHRDGPEAAYGYLWECEDSRYWLPMFEYYGIGTERNQEKAFRTLVDLASKGDGRCADAVAFLTDYHPPTYDARYPDLDLDEIRNSEYFEETPRWDYIEVADRSMLENSIEWELLEILLGIDCYGYYSYDGPFGNRESGYEDDVLYTRSDNQLEEGPPTFVFKPSGYCMGWYKYAWRSPEQNENLSIGEIKRIFRLCIEHKTLEREIPEGTTRDILALPMDTASVPEDLRESVNRICAASSVNRIGLMSTTGYRTFCKDGPGDAGKAIAGWKRWAGITDE